MQKELLSLEIFKIIIHPLEFEEFAHLIKIMKTTMSIINNLMRLADLLKINAPFTTHKITKINRNFKINLTKVYKILTRYFQTNKKLFARKNPKLAEKNFFTFQCQFPCLKLIDNQNSNEMNNFNLRYLRNRITFKRQFEQWTISTTEIITNLSNHFMLNLDRECEIFDVLFGLSNTETNKNMNKMKIKKLLISKVINKEIISGNLVTQKLWKNIEKHLQAKTTIKVHFKNISNLITLIYYVFSRKMNELILK
jgi:hypothetical protein